MTQLAERIHDISNAGDLIIDENWLLVRIDRLRRERQRRGARG